jgi:FKBP-type peptidyl-prolyl cis-trans isomerase FkpA
MKNYRILPGTWVFMLGFCCLMSSCIKKEDTTQDKQAQADDATIQQYLKAKNESAVTQTLGAYTYYSKVLTANPDGQATKALDIVEIYYTVSTLNGNGFDSVKVGSSPVKFQLLTQAGAIAPVGLDAGISLMRKGEKFRFYLPSVLAYGSYSYSADFPSNSNIIVDVEVVNILTTSQEIAVENQAIKKYIADNAIIGADSLGAGFYYQKTVDGTGNTPATGQTVKVAYVGKYLDGTIFDQTGTGSFSFAVNSNKVIVGFNDAIAKMKKGEKGKIFIPSNLAYGSGLQIIPKRIRPDLVTKQLISNEILPFSILIFEVEVQDFI